MPQLRAVREQRNRSTLWRPHGNGDMAAVDRPTPTAKPGQKPITPTHREVFRPIVPTWLSTSKRQSPPLGAAATEAAAIRHRCQRRRLRLATASAAQRRPSSHGCRALVHAHAPADHGPGRPGHKARPRPPVMAGGEDEPAWTAASIRSPVTQSTDYGPGTLRTTAA